MTVRYVDPAATGANNGTSWTDAWISIQSAFDTAIAGDIVYCRGTQTVSTQIDVDTNSGDSTSGFIQFIGCNASGNNDGTYFVLDANSANIDILAPAAKSSIWIENFEIKRSGNADGIDTTSAGSSGKWVFNHCSFHNNAGCGVRGDYFDRALFIRCCFYLNGHGFAGGGVTNGMLFCSFHDNTADGVASVSVSTGVFLGCLIYDNGDDGIADHASSSPSGMVFNCIIDGNAGDGIRMDATGTMLLVFGSRITNHTTSGKHGLNANSRPVVHGWNYYENNDGDNIGHSTLCIDLMVDGVATDVEDQSNTNQGYTALTDGSEDFNLRSDASLRRTAITIPLT